MVPLDSPFIFGNPQNLSSPSGSKVVAVGAELTSKSALLDFLSRALGFPGYSSENWDSFESCMKDLDWIPETQIRIVHTSLPLRDEPEGALQCYLQILRDLVWLWQSFPEHQLAVSSPEAHRDRIHDLMLASIPPQESQT
jgi:hypothetical protein